MELLTSFEGRIGRGRYWLGVLAIIAISIAVGAVLGIVAASIGSPALLLIGTLALYVVLVWFGAALTIKRLHDRDKPAVPWAVIFIGVPLLAGLMQLFGIGFAEPAPGSTVPIVSGLGAVVSLAALAVQLWALIELGFLRGTPGPNRFGPDPVAAPR